MTGCHEDHGMTITEVKQLSFRLEKLKKRYPILTEFQGRMVSQLAKGMAQPWYLENH